MISAFQSNAFQNNAFQIEVTTTTVVGGPVHGPARYRQRTSFNRDKQRFETLLEEIRDNEAVPSKAKTAVAAVKKARATILEAIEYREIKPDQTLQLARLLENARSASKAVAAIQFAKQAAEFAQNLMDEEDEEESLMFLSIL